MEPVYSQLVGHSPVCAVVFGAYGFGVRGGIGGRKPLFGWWLIKEGDEGGES